MPSKLPGLHPGRVQKSPRACGTSKRGTGATPAGISPGLRPQERDTNLGKSEGGDRSWLAGQVGNEVTGAQDLRLLLRSLPIIWQSAGNLALGRGNHIRRDFERPCEQLEPASLFASVSTGFLTVVVASCAQNRVHFRANRLTWTNKFVGRSLGEQAKQDCATSRWP